jgi:Ca2+-binding EF-hand superfamily protein
MVNERPSKEPAFGEASRLASKSHLDLYEVKYILKLFVEADATGSGGLDKGEFEVVIRKLFDVPTNTTEHAQMVDKAWERLAGPRSANAASAEANAETFVEWYSQNMFTTMVSATVNAGDPEQNESYELAKKYNITAPDVDKIKKRFNEFDLDGSGMIDYDEFMQMLCYVLRAKDPADISPDRAQRFWQEVDADGSGEIDFDEFCCWFVKYFNPNEDTMDLSRGPVEKFYDTFNPRKAMQRNNQTAKDKA